MKIFLLFLLKENKRKMKKMRDGELLKEVMVNFQEL
jgi:hypothetical protein